MAITPPSALANATMGTAKAFGSIWMLLQSNLWSSLRVVISCIVILYSSHQDCLLVVLDALLPSLSIALTMHGFPDGSARNTSILPQRFSILARVVGLFKAFYNRVNHRKFSGRLLRRLVSMWSITSCSVGGFPSKNSSTLTITIRPLPLFAPWNCW